MCGIAGIISSGPAVDLRTVRQMTDAVSHRGPDGDGHWVSADGRVGLGHRRLAIIDLSEGGRQPMQYLDGRYQITFNGEIYNYVELKKELVDEGLHFKSQSDTEVLLALFHRDREKCLEKLDGMFAFAIWDSVEKRLFCARDRFGEKPFYFAIHGERLFFGSEMKALWAAGVPRIINNKMLFNYLTNGYVYNPHDLTETFFENIRKLKASHYFYVSNNDLSAEQIRYWDIDPSTVDDSITEDDAKHKFREIFLESVSRRLRSDVPVGSSLSGGLDSSLIVCAIDELVNARALPQSTFSARFPNFAKDEGKYMQMVIERTNADPHFVFPDALGLVADLDTLYKHQEEPFGTASIYAQFCVMRLAKENEVTVLMDGQGADELLAGYPFYYQHYAGELKTRDRRTFQQERQARKSLTASSESKVRDLAVQTIPVGLQTRARELRQKLHNAVSPILNRDFFHEYEPTSFTSKEKVPETLNESLYKSCFGGSLEELLRYADRNSMAHSREVRLAFLSPDLAEFLFSLPPHFKIRNGVTKYIMRAAFSDLLPPEIRDRKDKIGYEPPQGQWLKHERIESGLRDAEKVLLDSKTLHPDYKKNLSRFAVSPAYADNNRWKILMAAGLIDSGGGS